MSEFISLIEALILLDDREVSERPKMGTNLDIECLELTRKNLEKASQLVDQIIKRGDSVILNE